MINISWLEIILFLSVVYVRSTETASCPQSGPTMARVPSCPKSLEEWKRRAGAKQCSVVQQQCQNDGEFVYHCVINIFANETLEVCAPKVKIIGRKCVEYNVLGARIQESTYVTCNGSCPFSYNSTDAYKYQDCFKSNTRKARTDNLNMSPTKASLNSNFNNSSCTQEDCAYPESSEWQIVALLMIAINVILFILILYLIVRSKGKKSTTRNGNTYDTVNTDESCKSDPSNSGTRKPSNHTQGMHVAGIDIGDTHLTMALSYPPYPEDVKLLGSLDRMCVLLNSRGKATHFGTKALQECTKEKETNDEHPDIRTFKLSDAELDSDVYNEALKWIMERVESEVRKVLPGVKQSDIYYVFIVPNYWDKNAVKDFKKNLSKIKKLPYDKYRVIKRKLTLSPFIHEVKARVVCLNFNVDNLLLRPGSESNTYAILHVGSSHRDLIFVEGGRDPNYRDSPFEKPMEWDDLPQERVLNFFGSIYGEDEMTKWRKKYKREYVSFLLHFEKLVKDIDECRTDDEKFPLKLSKEILEIAKENLPVDNEEDCQKKIRQKIKDSEMEGISLGDNNWTFQIELKWLKFFFQNMNEEVNKMLEISWENFKEKNAKFVVMTGAYSKRKIIWDIAEKAWFKGKDITIVVPEDSHVFAMGGAYYGQKETW